MVPSIVSGQLPPSRAALLVGSSDQECREATTRIGTLLGLSVDHFATLEEVIAGLSREKVACAIVSLATENPEHLELLGPLLANPSGAPVILTSPNPPTPCVVQAMRRGAFSVLREPLDEESLRITLVQAIKQARHAGRDHDLVADYHRRLDRLSEGERSVLEAICNGRLNKQIARELGVSVRTIEQRRQRIFRKMDVPSAVPLACHITTARTLERLHGNSRLT